MTKDHKSENAPINWPVTLVLGGTFLESASIVPCSSVTGEGLELSIEAPHKFASFREREERRDTAKYDRQNFRHRVRRGADEARFVLA